MTDPGMDEDVPAEAPPRGRGRIAAAVVALAAIAAFGVGIWYAYDQGVKKGTGTPPVVKADRTPTKVQPENPGGMAVPNQDKQVYERLAGQPPATTQVERLLPPPERPAPEPPRPAATTAAPPMPPPPPQASTSSPASPPPPPPAPSPAPPPVTTAAAPPPPPPSALSSPPSAPAAPPPVVAKSASVASGAARIQLAAHRDVAGAEADWKRLQKKFPDTLGGLTSHLEQVTLAGKGTFQRLQAGPFADRATAQAACDKLKAAKQDCIVVGK